MLHTFDQGLKLVHQHHPGELVSIQFWYEVGTVDEPPGLEGAAHLLEHLLFKRSKRFEVGEAAARIEAVGGELNAYTTWDQTVFHATGLAQHAERFFDTLHEMTQNPLLTEADLIDEKPVVMEEIRGYAQDPESVLQDVLNRALFPEHPYGNPILGSLESVEGMEHHALVEFFRSHYVAPRCILSVVGPVTFEEVQLSLIHI